MRARWLLLVLAVVAADASAALLEGVSLQWKPTSELKLGAAQMPQTSIRFDTFKDARADKAAIGENREDDAHPKPVTTRDDVVAFVSSHMRELFDRAGLKTVDGNAAVTIHGEVQQFFVREAGTYKGEVAVHLTVIGQDGRTLWSGLASGEATRFGRSYKLENYDEVLSDALVNTVSSMLQSAQFQKALTAQSS
jgi:hypothetical protein